MVQAQLGHATASITLDTYGHLFPDELDQLASRLDAARAEALEARQAARGWPQSGPTVVQLSETRKSMTALAEEVGFEPSAGLLRRPRSRR